MLWLKEQGTRQVSMHGGLTPGGHGLPAASRAATGCARSRQASSCLARLR